MPDFPAANSESSRLARLVNPALPIGCVSRICAPFIGLSDEPGSIPARRLSTDGARPVFPQSRRSSRVPPWARASQLLPGGGRIGPLSAEPPQPEDGRAYSRQPAGALRRRNRVGLSKSPGGLAAGIVHYREPRGGCQPPAAGFWPHRPDHPFPAGVCGDRNSRRRPRNRHSSVSNRRRARG